MRPPQPSERARRSVATRTSSPDSPSQITRELFMPLVHVIAMIDGDEVLVMVCVRILYYIYTYRQVP